MTTTLHFGWPQIVYLTLNVIALLYQISVHGKPKTGLNDASAGFVSVLIMLTLLWCGGFFTQG